MTQFEQRVLPATVIVSYLLIAYWSHLGASWYHPSTFIMAGVIHLGHYYDFMVIIDQKQFDSFQVMTLINLFFYIYIGSFCWLKLYCSDLDLWLGKTLIVLCSDLAQYIIGTRYGRYHINPLSPNKTLEGYFGSLVVVIPFLYFFPAELILKTIILGIIGDVYVSGLKRILRIKDTSDLFMAHGGWIDRFDGVYCAMMF